MRRLITPFITLALVGIAHQSSTGQLIQPRDAATVLAEARTALGGEARLAAVKTFIANGRTRQVRGDNLIPIEFEIQAELPDKYSRRDEFPAQDAGPTTAGFVGDALVLIPRPAPPPDRPGAPAPPPAQQEAALRARVMTAKQDFARLVLGMFATSLPSFPLTFTYAAQAEAPQGKADVLDVKGPANFSARLFIHADTHLPIMLTWQAGPPPRAVSTPPGGPAPPPGPPPGASPGATVPPGTTARPGPMGPPGTAPGPGPGPGAPSPPPEQRMFFADYREVDGFRLPFRIRRAAGSETTEETIFDRFRINARVDPRRFDTASQ